MKRNSFLLVVIASLMFSLANFNLVSAADNGTATNQPRVQVNPATPGIYTFTTAPGQIVGFYPIETVPIENKSTLVRFFTKILGNDAGKGTKVEVAEQECKDGHKRVLVAIGATPATQESVKYYVDLINAGKINIFDPGIDALHYFPKYRSAQDLVTIMEKEITVIGYTYADTAVNKVTVVDDPTLFGYLKSILEANDVPSKQLRVEIQVVERRVGDGQNVGVDLEAWKRALPSNVGFSIAGGPNEGGGGLQANSFEAVASGMSPQALASFLNYMQENGNARVEASTSINVANGEPATFKAGQEVPYQVITKQGTGGTNEITTEVAFVGLKVDIDATVSQAQTRFKVKADSTSVVARNPYGPPTTTHSSTSTTVDVAGDKTIVLSGLKRTSDIEVRRGVPLL